VSWDEKPVVITVAPTGAEVTREDNPALPHTPAEIAADALACAEAGASVVHLHVREEDGTPSGRPELFAETIERIRAESSLITMVSTGGAVWMSIEERTTGLEADPDLAGVEHWSVTAVGRHQRRMLALAVLHGAGGIRVGFEDGVYIRRGRLAESNAELVAAAAELVRTLGRRVATIDEARELLAVPVRTRELS
jgi:uncharacterized protein (DUF849 family)